MTSTIHCIRRMSPPGRSVAQEVARRYLEPILEPVFHADSYGYRPGKSAIDAVHQARQRCWRYDWVLDLDIKGFFDNIDWELLLKAVRHHTDCPWVLLYIERWLKAPMQMEYSEEIEVLVLLPIRRFVT
jgi:RNA-directed DNA polymerase